MATARNLEPSPQRPSPYTGFDRMLIGGTWRAGRSTRTLEDRNPFNDEVLVRIPLASREDLDLAYRTAAEAQPRWAAMLPAQRAAILRRAAAIMDERKDEIAGWIVREAGGTMLKCDIEISSARDITFESASFPYRVEGRILPCDIPGKESRVYRRPLGVVGVISPWNFPFHLSNRSVAPALAVGNAVVLKPASDTPVTGGLLLAKVYEEAGVPPGVFSVIVGAGSEIGDAFVTHAAPRLISFTGSTEVGRHIAALAGSGDSLKKVALELGGNGPMVILDDADLDVAVPAAAFGKFLNQGEICMITNRFVVDAHVHDEFVRRFTERVRSLRCGDPGDPATVIGPLINRHQLEGIQKLIAKAKEEGAKQVLGGEPQGLVLPPQVFVGVDNRMTIAQSELFGPVATIIEVNGEEEALAVANDTSYGLSSAVFTRDLERGVRFALRIQAGMTHVNDMPVADLPNAPFGGEKNSGLGRFGGHWAIDEFTTDHWITVQHEPRPYPF